MPTTNILVDEVQTNVIDTVTHQATISILKDLNLYEKFKDRNITITSDHQRDASSRDVNENLRLENSDRCNVLATLTSNPQRMKWDILHFGTLQTYGQAGSQYARTMQFPLFSDNTIGLRVIEQMSPRAVELEFTLTFKDKNDALKTEAIIANKYHGTALLNVHDLVYTYPLNIEFLSVLKCFYNLRTSYNQSKDFITYLKEFFSKEMVFEHLKDNDTKKRPCLKAYQINALGLLEYDQERPEPVIVENVTDRWEVRFRYSIQFGCPDSFIIDYPTVVENQLVPTFVTPPVQDTTYNFMELEGYLQTKPFTHVLRQLYGRTSYLIRIPTYETFNPPRGPLQTYAYKPFLISALLLEENGSSTFDLKEIGDVHLHGATVEIMKRAGLDVLGYSGLFNVTVYARDAIIREGISIDEDLILTLDDFDRTIPYYLVLSEATTLTNLNVEAIEDLQDYRWFFATLIAQNLNYMITHRWLKVVPSYQLIALISRLIANMEINAYIEWLYAEGHAGKDIFQVSFNVYVFCEYIGMTISKIDPSKRFLYDILMEKLSLDGKVFPPYPKMYVRTTDNNYPLKFNSMETDHALSVPFRVAQYRLTAGQ
jgi:hypothetical protein